MSNEEFNKKEDRKPGMYFHVFDYSLVRKSNKPVNKPGWDKDPVETTNPQTKDKVHTWVERYDSIVARIIDVNKYTVEYQGRKFQGFNIKLLAGNKMGTLKLSWLEHVLQRFLKVAPNIDFNKPIRIAVFAGKKKDGSKTTAVSFNQGDQPNSEDWPKVDEFYGKENEEMPKAIFYEESNEWDFKAQDRFLGLKFAEDTLPKIKEIAAYYEANPPALVAEQEEDDDEPVIGAEEEKREPDASGTGQSENRDIMAQAKAAHAARTQAVGPDEPSSGASATAADSFMDAVRPEAAIPAADPFGETSPVKTPSPDEDIPW